MTAKEALLSALSILVVGVVLAMPVACTMHQQQLIADAIKDGKDPIAAKCAIQGSNERSVDCILKAAGK